MEDRQVSVPGRIVKGATFVMTPAYDTSTGTEFHSDNVMPEETHDGFVAAAPGESPVIHETAPPEVAQNHVAQNHFDAVMPVEFPAGSGPSDDAARAARKLEKKKAKKAAEKKKLQST